MILLPTILFFILGLIIGSFLNVVIFRFNTKRSFGGRSACLSCQRKLSWYELIPVVSFLWLWGRCRNCKTKISIQYPLVELATGLIFASLFLKFQDIFLTDIQSFSIIYVYYATAFSLLMIIATYDLKHKIIPDALSLVFGAIAFLGLFFFHNNFFDSSYPVVLYFQIPTVLEFLSGVFIAFPFAFFWFISKGRWMGLGDAKLALGIGWLLGVPLSLSGLVLAFWIGAVFGVTLVVLSKRHKIGGMGMKSEIPFAPFLVLGSFLAFIFQFIFFPIW
mgnify:CR=1 FL=1